LHPKNSQRTEAIFKKEYAEIYIREDATNYLSSLMKKLIDKELAEIPQVAQEEIQIAEAYTNPIFIYSPTDFSRIVHGIGDSRKIVQALISSKVENAHGLLMILITGVKPDGSKAFKDGFKDHPRMISKKNLHKVYVVQVMKLHAIKKDDYVWCRRAWKQQI